VIYDDDVTPPEFGSMERLRAIEVESDASKLQEQLVDVTQRLMQLEDREAAAGREIGQVQLERARVRDEWGILTEHLLTLRRQGVAV
jgi:predicted  nucleic acid-binding Zn-ribbon protein